MSQRLMDTQLCELNKIFPCVEIESKSFDLLKSNVPAMLLCETDTQTLLNEKSQRKSRKSLLHLMKKKPLSLLLSMSAEQEKRGVAEKLHHTAACGVALGQMEHSYDSV